MMVGYEENKGSTALLFSFVLGDRPYVNILQEIFQQAFNILMFLLKVFLLLLRVFSPTEIKKTFLNEVRVL